MNTTNVVHVMKVRIIKMGWTAVFSLLISTAVMAQGYKSYDLTVDGDTINIIDANGKKQGPWVLRVEEVRGEPGYEEEGMFKDDYKNGYWRRYSLQGDLMGVEHYKFGGKDGLQQYFTFFGNLEREENWRGYNPDAPYDTIAVYGAGSNEIVDFKIVKAEPYSVRHGVWKYYDEGRLMRSEEYDRNNLVIPKETATAPVKEKPKEVEKTAEMLEWEKKNRGKKGALRDGRTGM
ncbi:MAG TPA: hypothetical protein PLU07_09850 [Ferruginibacter sp.]|nr:hypothetical protein [Ferruginibacter sp.]